MHTMILLGIFDMRLRIAFVLNFYGRKSRIGYNGCIRLKPIRLLLHTHLPVLNVLRVGLFRAWLGVLRTSRCGLGLCGMLGLLLLRRSSLSHVMRQAMLHL